MLVGAWRAGRASGRLGCARDARLAPLAPPPHTPPHPPTHPLAHPPTATPTHPPRPPTPLRRQPAPPKLEVELPYRLYRLVRADGTPVERADKHPFCMSRVYYDGAEKPEEV